MAELTNHKTLAYNHSLCLYLSIKSLTFDHYIFIICTIENAKALKYIIIFFNCWILLKYSIQDPLKIDCVASS